MLVVKQRMCRKMEDAVSAQVFADHEIAVCLEIEGRSAGAGPRGSDDGCGLTTREQQARQMKLARMHEIDVAGGSREPGLSMRIVRLPLRAINGSYRFRSHTRVT